MGCCNCCKNSSDNSDDVGDSFRDPTKLVGYIVHVPKEYEDMFIYDYSSDPSSLNIISNKVRPSTPVPQPPPTATTTEENTTVTTEHNMNRQDENAANINNGDANGQDKTQEEKNVIEFPYKIGCILSSHGKYLFKLTDIQVYQQLLIGKPKGFTVKDLLNPQHDIRLFQYLPVLFDKRKIGKQELQNWNNFDIKNGNYSYYATNIKLLPNITKNEMKNLIINSNMQKNVLEKLIVDLAICKNYHKKNENKNKNKNKNNKTKKNNNNDKNKSKSQSKAKKKKNKKIKNTKNNVNTDKNDNKTESSNSNNNSSNKQLLRLTKNESKLICNEILNGHRGELFSYNIYYIRYKMFWDSKTDNSTLNNIFYIPKNMNDIVDINTTSAKPTKSKLNSRNVSENNKKYKNKFDKNSANDLTRRLLSTSTASNSVVSEIGQNNISLLTEKYNIVERKEYIISIIDEIVKNVNGLLNGDGGNFWCGIIDDADNNYDNKEKNKNKKQNKKKQKSKSNKRIIGIHLLPSEMFFIKKEVKKEIENFGVDTYQQIREMDRKNAKQRQKMAENTTNLFLQSFGGPHRLTLADFFELNIANTGRFSSVGQNLDEDKKEKDKDKNKNNQLESKQMAQELTVDSTTGTGTTTIATPSVKNNEIPTYHFASPLYHVETAENSIVGTLSTPPFIASTPDINDDNDLNQLNDESERMDWNGMNEIEMDMEMDRMSDIVNHGNLNDIMLDHHNNSMNNMNNNNYLKKLGHSNHSTESDLTTTISAIAESEDLSLGRSVLYQSTIREEENDGINGMNGIVGGGRESSRTLLITNQLKAKYGKINFQIDFYPLVSENGYIIQDWYILHCSINSSTNGSTESDTTNKIEFINNRDGNIYVKSMSYFICKKPDKHYYDQNKNILYDAKTGKVRQEDTRLNKIVLGQS